MGTKPDIIKHYDSVSDELIERYRAIEESASINECLPESGALQHDFRPVWPEQRMVGRAFTVRARAGDNLILHKAITMLKPNDVLVVTCDGFQESGGMWGGIMSLSAKTQGAEGMIIDGCVRDSIAVRKSGFKIWSRGLSIKRSTKITPGKINHPIVIGNVNVNPGDLIFADNDAVVVVPKEVAEETLEKTLAREAHETEMERIVQKDPCYSFNTNFKKAFDALGLTEEE